MMETRGRREEDGTYTIIARGDGLEGFEAVFSHLGTLVYGEEIQDSPLRVELSINAVLGTTVLKVKLI